MRIINQLYVWSWWPSPTLTWCKIAIRRMNRPITEMSIRSHSLQVQQTSRHLVQSWSLPICIVFFFLYKKRLLQICSDILLLLEILRILYNNFLVCFDSKRLVFFFKLFSYLVNSFYSTYSIHIHIVYTVRTVYNLIYL